MSIDFDDVGAFLKANPQHGYGYAVGYIAGLAAARIKSGQFLGLSPGEWLNATDDYAWGYRAGHEAGI